MEGCGGWVIVSQRRQVNFSRTVWITFHCRGATSKVFSQADMIRVGAPDAWAVTKGDPNMLVAVIDTDIDATQPDLAGKVVMGANFSGDDTPDPEGHGTAVAGLIAAVPNNGIGIAGLGWNTRPTPWGFRWLPRVQPPRPCPASSGRREKTWGSRPWPPASSSSLR